MREQLVQWRISDDFDGAEIVNEPAESINFRWDGTDYEVDLRPANARKFRDMMQVWVNAARPANAEPAPESTGNGRSRVVFKFSSYPPEQRAAIRKWGQRNNLCASHGRVADAVVDAYEAAHRAKSA